VFCCSFPKDPKLRQQWIAAVRRKDYVPSASAVLCTKHFKPEDVDRTSLCCVRIRDNAVPSVFPAFPSYLQTVKKARKTPRQRHGHVLSLKSSTPSERLSSEELTSASQTSDVINTQSSSGLQSQHTVSEHSYSSVPMETDVNDTPRKAALKRKLSNVQQQLASSRKKIKVLLQSKRRLIKRNAKLQSVIDEIRKQRLLTENSIDVLEKSACGIGELLMRRMNKQLGRALPTTYSAELRSFALTLHFYSPRAYEYVRKVFDTCLPHPKTIQKWYRCIDGKPGFSEDAFRALQARVNSRSTPTVCVLMMDEVAIRQQLDWDGKRYHGYIDMGTEIDNDSLPMAKEALVFMVVAVNDHFKLPVGYFLINGLGALERANLIKQCLTKLNDVGVNVVSLTFDGAASNLSMASLLGCNLNDAQSADFNTSFSHPVTNDAVVILPDPCHMLKLVRNTLTDKKSVVDDQNKIVNFDYINKLHKLQEKEGLHLGNRLRSAHIASFKKKMNVKLAAQLLSQSVATSLEFCMRENLPDFVGAGPTIRFICMFDKLFDVLNSRNLMAKGFKRPIKESNWAEIAGFLAVARSYILSLKESVDGRTMINSNRKTGFLGFIICIDSLIKLYIRLIESGSFGVRFLCTYKFSQDHLELLFGKIRSLGGCNNNPTARQFCAAYKKLLVRNEIQDVMRGNCLPLQIVPILNVSSVTVCNDTPAMASLNNSSTKSRMFDLLDGQGVTDHNYAYVPNPIHLSACSEKIVAYIAGFVVFKLKHSLKCEQCVSALSDSIGNQYCSLIELKTRGGLVYPSNDVIDLCLTCEKFFRKCVYTSGNSAISSVKCYEMVQSVLKSYINKDVFVSLAEHMLECEPLSNHVILLIKAVAEKYLQVRYFYAGRQFSAVQIANKQHISRQVSNKLILFHGL
jgi:hypothetical protein